MRDVEEAVVARRLRGVLRLSLMAFTTMALALVIAACGGAGSGEDTVAGEDVTVRMFDNRFEYTEIRVPVGGTVSFLGAGRSAHNAVAADGSWSTQDVHGDLEQFDGDAAVMQFDQPGEYLFFCTFHGNAEGEGMAGRLIVEQG